MILFSNLAALVLAAAPVPPPHAAAAPDTIACVALTRTGSILPTRVCHTAAEWSRIRETERDICGPATTDARGHCSVQLTSNGEQVTVRSHG